MTVYSEGVWRKQVTATRPNPGVEAKQVVMIPEGVTDLTIYAKGSAASSCLVEESPSSGEAIQFGTPTPEWVQVDASLAAVGTTLTRFVLGDRTPVALRVSSLIDNQTATLIVVGKRVA